MKEELHLNINNRNYNMYFTYDEDLDIEDKRNLNEELNKILNRINSASMLSLDPQSLLQLNRIKSMAKLNSIGGKENLRIMDINMINQV